jgi:hypothetical protein
MHTFIVSVDVFINLEHMTMLIHLFILLHSLYPNRKEFIVVSIIV